MRLIDGRLYAGIEGSGSSRSTGVVADVHGNILTARSFGLRLCYRDDTLEDSAAHAYRMLKEMLLTLEISVESFWRRGGILCIASHGIRTRHDREIRVPEIAKAAGFPVSQTIPTGDAEAVFAGTAMRHEGGCIVANTGAIVMGRGRSQICMAAGRAVTLDDVGSGYWIGRRVLRNLCMQHDEGSVTEGGIAKVVFDHVQALPAWPSLLAEFGDQTLHPIDALGHLAQAHAVGPGFRYFIASFARPALSYLDANPGDPEIGEIARVGAQSLARSLKAAMNRCGVNGGVPVALWGGLVKFHPAYRELLREEVQRVLAVEEFLMPPDTPDSPTFGPAVGALLFALAGSSLDLPPDAVMMRVRQTAVSHPLLRDQNE